MSELLRFRVIIPLIIPFLFLSCHNSSKESSNLPIIHPLLTSAEIKDFTNYVTSIRYLKLKSPNEPKALSVQEIQLSKDGKLLIAASNGLFLFDETGNQLIKYGAKGKGPGEYLNRRSFCLSSNEESVIILDTYNTLYFYNYSSGKFEKQVTPQWKEKSTSADDICPGEDGGFFLYRPQSFNPNDFTNDFYCLTEFDMKGKLKNEFLKRIDFNFNFPVFFKTTQGYLIRPTEGTDIVYRITEGRIQKDFRISFDKKAVPLKHIFSYGADAWKHLEDYLQSDYFKLFMTILETDRQLYIYCAGPQARAEYFLLSKDGLSGIRWSESELEEPLILLCGSNNYFLTTINETKASMPGENSIGPLKKYIIDHLPENIDPETDEVLVFLEFSIQ